MQFAKSLAALLVVIGLLAGYALMAVAADAAGSAPVLDRIMSKKELVVGTAASMPPLNMTLKDGQIAGMEIDLARYIANSLEVKLTLKAMPFNELLPALESGRVDMVISAMTITAARNSKFAFAGPYFASGKSLLLKRQNAETMNEVARINDPERILVALKGSTSQLFAEKVFPKAKLVLTDNYDQAVTLIRENKAHALVADQPICQVSVFRYPDADLAALKNTLSYEAFGIAIPANDFLFLNLLQNFITGLENSGEMRNLVDRWFKDGAWVSQLR
jgi:polar amino acid transport system substrate-binding protein